MESETQCAYGIEYNPANYIVCTEGSVLSTHQACRITYTLFQILVSQHGVYLILIRWEVSKELKGKRGHPSLKYTSKKGSINGYEAEMLPFTCGSIARLC